MPALNPRPTSDFSMGRLTMVMLVGSLLVFAGLELYGHGSMALPSRDRLTLAEKAYRFGDNQEAARLFGRVAKNGNATAEYWLAHMTELGLGVPRNPAHAIELYQKAAKQHFIMAEIRLGEIYLDGNLVLPSPKRARKYLQDAANQGNARAAMLLGQIYRDGIGVPANPTRADAWFEVAALEGNTMAKRERGMSFRDLSTADQKDVIAQTQNILKAIKREALPSASSNLKKTEDLPSESRMGLSHLS